MVRWTFFGAWLTGVILYLARFLLFYRKTRRLIAGSRPHAACLPVPVAYTAGTAAPALAGIFHPMILLPAGIVDWATEEEQQAILLHELAHFKRRDYLITVLQAAVESVLFFHPAVRYALRQLAIERELACDEYVLRAGTKPAVYADAILKAAEHGIGRNAAFEIAFNMPGKILERRVHMILTYKSPIFRARFLKSLACSAAVFGIAFVLLPHPTRASGAQQHQTLAIAPSPTLSRPPAVQPEAGEQPARIAVVASLPRQPRPAVPAPQVQGVRLSGVIYDQTGAIIPGVQVRLKGESETGRTAISTANGSYSFSDVQPGRYTFEADLPGFVAYRRIILVPSTDVIGQDVLLQLGRLTTTVDVTTNRPAQPATPPQPAGDRRPIRVGGNVSTPNLIFAPKPVYPPSARANQIQDFVVLQGVIGVDGTVVSLQVDPAQGSSNLALVASAIEAVRQWRYQPAFLNGQPVEFATTITVNFTLAN
jgi:TonB family protein